jgi:uncharacterized protein (UPF0332 family)
MSDAESRAAMVAHWLLKADEALAAARREHQAGDFGLTINRVYYACFYAACAVMLAEGRTFTKHAGLRSAVHQHLVKPGRLSSELGEFYDRAFDDRMEVDYQIVAPPDADSAMQQVEAADQFVAKMKRLMAG